MDRLIKNEHNGDWNVSWNSSRPSSGRTCSELDELNVILNGFKYTDNSSDVWKWNPNTSGSFKSSDLTSLINSKVLLTISSAKEAMRNNLIPQKLGILVWQAKMQRLPVLVELDKRGVDLDSVRCPICDDNVETTDHILFKCSFAIDIWSCVYRWWNLGSFSSENSDTHVLRHL
ncbi:uncharacterized protein [Rutidosis leptorrhynchoides]|uniref:uncharacterized protein n=1 Tax=Rutidosis leptorrhynchoides TaxID=125765 RepID=UPI003A99504D